MSVNNSLYAISWTMLPFIGQISILRYVIGEENEWFLLLLEEHDVIWSHKSMKNTTVGPEKSDVIGNLML